MAQLLTPGSILAMTDQAADRLIKLDSGDAALLYLHLLRRGSPEGLRWPEERKRAALKQLQDQGLASLSLIAAPAAPEEPPEAPPPEYALEDINTALSDKASTFPALCDEVERLEREGFACVSIPTRCPLTTKRRTGRSFARPTMRATRRRNARQPRGRRGLVAGRRCHKRGEQCR